MLFKRGNRLRRNNFFYPRKNIIKKAPASDRVLVFIKTCKYYMSMCFLYAFNLLMTSDAAPTSPASLPNVAVRISVRGARSSP